MSLDHLFSTLNGEVIILCVATMNLATFAQNTCTCFCFILLYLARYMEINIHAIGAINACLLAVVYKVLYSNKADIFCLNSRFLPISVYKTISNFRLRACMTFHFLLNLTNCWTFYWFGNLGDQIQCHLTS